MGTFNRILPLILKSKREGEYASYIEKQQQNKNIQSLIEAKRQIENMIKAA